MIYTIILAILLIGYWTESWTMIEVAIAVMAVAELVRIFNQTRRKLKEKREAEKLK